MRTFVLGNQDCVLGLSLVGVDGRPVSNSEELAEALDQALADRSIGLLLITSDVAEWLRERIDTLKVQSLTPLVVEIPGLKGANYPSLKEFVQRAVGISLGGHES